jgi:DNA polymerase III sliding clamp (beta) subunit (PCNA family)
MKVNKNELQTALEKVRPGLSTKEILDQSTSFAFIGGKVITFNDKISISHPVEGLDLEGAIKAEELYKILSKLKSEEIKLRISDGKILMRSGKTKVELVLENKILLPLNEISETEDWEELPEDFTDALTFTMGCCTRDMSKPKLTCVHINADGFMEGSDGFRIGQYMFDDGFDFDTFLIQADSVREVVKIKPTEISLSEGWVHFRNEEGTIISARTFADEEYPDTTNVLEVRGEDMKLPDDIIDILDRASVFAKRDHILDESVSVIFEENKVTLKAKSETGSQFEEWAKTENKSEGNFQITPYLLRDILSRTLDFTMSPQMLKFEASSWIYVTALKEDNE